MAKKLEIKNHNAFSEFDAVDYFTVEENQNFVKEGNDIVAQTDNSSKAEKQIEKFFPTDFDIEIPLEELDTAPDEWNFFKLPDEETFKLIIKSIYYQGQLSPALVWKQADGRYMILGGHTRFTALKVLQKVFPDEAERFSKMKCHVYDVEQLDESAAKYILIMNNMTQRASEAPSMMIKSITKMMDLQKQLHKGQWGELPQNSSEAVAQSLGVGTTTIKKYYRLRNLISEFAAMLDNNEITQAQALALAGTTEELQKYILEKGYHNIKDERFKNIAKAISVDEIELVVASNERQTMNGKALTYNIPKSFNKLTLAVDKEDEDLLRIALMEVISTLEFKNEDSKKVLLDVLS